MQYPGKNKRIRFEVDRSSVFAHGAVIFMLLAAAFRLVGCWGLWREELFAMTQIALPIVSCLLFAACIPLFGKHFWVSMLPVCLGMVFFVVRTLSMASPLMMVLGILLCFAVTLVYIGTVTGLIRWRIILLVLLTGPFLYKLLVVDTRALRDTANAVSFADGMQEISVLCMLLGLILTVPAMKKILPQPEVELPKIKDPKVIPPKRMEDEPAAVTETLPPAEPQTAPEGTPDQAPKPAEESAPAESRLTESVPAAEPDGQSLSLSYEGESKTDSDNTGV